MVAFCPKNHFVNLEASVAVDGRRLNLGARCDACPGTSTSPGGQNTVCDNCPGIPAVLPAGARVQSGCSIGCASQLYVYKAGSNSCVYRTHASGHQQSANPQSEAMSMAVGILVCACLICVCCYAFKGPLHPSNLSSSRAGLAQGGPAQALPRVQPVRQVVVLDLSLIHI